ncbi:hypothetical protein FRB97_009028 [Tulasnella sp. 331]|nr:hypothetical protein FRB97_009028 [Tulasnella sp. 331]
MSFVPKHPQPFSMNVAIELSIPEITGEIARLQLSLERLGDTQMQLSECLSGPDSGDVDLIAAFDENKATMSVDTTTDVKPVDPLKNFVPNRASQEERIQMLRVALERKGATAVNNAHYTPVAAASIVSTGSTAAPEPAEEEGGVYL